MFWCIFLVQYILCLQRTATTLDQKIEKIRKKRKAEVSSTHSSTSCPFRFYFLPVQVVLPAQSGSISCLFWFYFLPSQVLLPVFKVEFVLICRKNQLSLMLQRRTRVMIMMKRMWSFLKMMIKMMRRMKMSLTRVIMRFWPNRVSPAVLYFDFWQKNHFQSFDRSLLYWNKKPSLWSPLKSSPVVGKQSISWKWSVFPET